MPRALPLVRGALTAGALLVLLSTCDSLSGPASREATAQKDTQDLLRGTWLREYAGDGVQVRRILSLESGGTFHENVRVVERDGRVTRYAHEGTWIYDGTNLKRKYTLMNGEPPSRLNVPFATFQISFQSANEFTGVDHIHGHRIDYRRVGDTAP